VDGQWPKGLDWFPHNICHECGRNRTHDPWNGCGECDPLDRYKKTGHGQWELKEPDQVTLSEKTHCPICGSRLVEEKGKKICPTGHYIS
jgi:RNA polymerase subunit RPABC4/transcription elongation factor Spt4